MKWTPARVGLAAAVVVAGLYGWDAVMPRQGELVPFSQRVSFEEYMSRQLPELSRMAGQVAAETGGELTVMGLPYVQRAGSTTRKAIGSLATARWLRRSPLIGLGRS